MTLRSRLSTLALCAALGAPGVVSAQQQTTLIERHPTDHESFTTGNILPRGALKGALGFQQTNPWIETPGTSNQVYLANLALAPISGLEFGLDYMNFVDPPPFPIVGAPLNSQIQVIGGGLRAKVRLYQAHRIRVAGQVAAERMKFDSPIFGATSNEYLTVGSAHLPVSYEITPTLQAHVTPGISVFPGRRSTGGRFYGTIASVGAGLSWLPTRRIMVYGNATQPLTGANTILSDGSYARRPVLTLGAHYAIGPNSAFEFWATNGLGATPTSGILTFFPNADIVIVGAKLVHTFGPGAPSKAPYGRDPQQVLTPRQRILAGDGFTLSGPRTRGRGAFEAQGYLATQGGRGASLSIAPDHFLELRASYESPANDGSGAVNTVFGDSDRWEGRFKFQLLDQADGWPGSLAVNLALGRDRKERGVFFVSAPMMTSVTKRLALRMEPKVAMYGTPGSTRQQTQLGLGLGAVQTVGRYANLLAELTIKDEGDPVWAIGAKTRFARSPLELGIYATNAIGTYGVLGMTPQSDPKIAVTISNVTNLFR